ncbi:hypothetical protein PYW08_007756 [Mythimna loreyi]|uniref:Uncharacterized protein n=1 Tax=Mythimna loreyi TaxID=667449 RepID=A0ACC2QFA6_9NEOP|nr:hypothetical protein PYW08_007756 [Mythimna loreyi]
MDSNKFYTKPTESDARSESDEASGRSSEGSDVEEVVGVSGGNASSFRKRPKSKSRDRSSSDEDKGSAPKIPTSSRGGGRGGGRGRGLTSQEAAQRADKLAAEGRHPGVNSAGADNPQPSGGEPDAGENSAAEARKRLSDVVVEVLTAISRKKKWEKGTKTKGIAAFAATIMEAMDASFEERDAKLRKELMGALPAGPPQAAKEKEGRTQEQGPKQPQPQPEPESQLLTLVRQELAAFRLEQKKQQEQLSWRLFGLAVLSVAIEHARAQLHHKEHQGPQTCGGHLKQHVGTITTPNFPNPFPVPIKCKWIIEHDIVNGTISIYFTQQYTTSGLTFTEYTYYDQSYKLGERRALTVTEDNITKIKYLQVQSPVLVVELTLDRLEGTQLRALGLLSVYGFNVTYELQK